MNDNQFIANAKAYEKQHVNYIWGMKGQVATEALLQQCIAEAKKTGRYTFTQTKIDYARKNVIAKKKIAGDCSWLLTASAGLPVMGSATIWAECTNKGLIANIPNVPGLVVYRNGHIGIYLGNGQVLENGGYCKGVVTTNINAPATGSAWTGYGYWKRIIYTSKADVTETIDCPYSEPKVDYTPSKKITGNDGFWFQWELQRIGYTLDRMGCNDGKLDGVVSTMTWPLLIFEMGQCRQTSANATFRAHLKSVPTKQ